jgi:hypothetical protein
MTRFNTEVSPQRVFDTRRFALADFKAIRALVPKVLRSTMWCWPCVPVVCAATSTCRASCPGETLLAAAPIAVQQ